MKGRFVLGGLIAAAMLVAVSSAAAHDFTAAILVVGEQRETRLAEAVRGFLLAADERDGHAGETSDGHLGGVDVHILPLPPEAAGKVSGLAGNPKPPAGVVVVVGPEAEADAALAGLKPAAVGMRPGALPQGWFGDEGADSFAVRYRRAYGSAPTEAAAQGYNAARRLDLAIRPLDGIGPQSALAAALANTQSGIAW